MTFGDVFAMAGVIAATAVTTWMTILAGALLFSRRSRLAADLLAAHPGQMIGLGAALGFIGVGLGLVFLNLPSGLVKLFGFALLAVTLAIALLGASGLAQIAAARMRAQAPAMSEFAALGRGAALLVGAGLLPGVGWLLLFPLQLFASVGAGITALRGKEATASLVAEPIQP